MTKEQKEHTAKNLKTAFKDASFLDYKNGMATNPVIVEREYEKVKIIRKCASLDFPEIFLIVAKPKEGFKEPNINVLAKDIKDALGLYGDISLNFNKSKDSVGTFTCVISSNIVSVTNL